MLVSYNLTDKRAANFNVDIDAVIFTGDAETLHDILDNLYWED